MAKQLKKWQGWLLFGAALVVVFLLGLLVSSLVSRNAEVASVYNNRQNPMTDSIVSQNEKFAQDFPREYETWAMTEDTTFESEFNGSAAKDALEQHPAMVINWAGYAFSRDYNTPRGHHHCIDDLREILRTGAPNTDEKEMQPGTCWTCKGPDVPRLMREKGLDNYYSAKWSDWGSEVVNSVGCSDCHDARTMDLKISRPALVEAFARQGKDIKKATHQEMRSLVCAQCHVEYYFAGDKKHLTFPWDKGFTCEDMEAYYDSVQFKDFEHKISRAPILKAQHPGYETSMMGIHAQRGVSCADCHMPYMSEGGVKFSDHHVMSPLAHIDRTCQTCHRQDAETLRQNVYDRQRKVADVRNQVETALATAHLEAGFAWEKGATEAEMKPILQLLRKSQWRWDFAVASHGAAFHATAEVLRLLGGSLNFAQEARLATAKVLAKHGVTDIPAFDFSTKEKAQKLIGLDMQKLRAQKKNFLDTMVPKWVAAAKKSGKLIEL